MEEEYIELVDDDKKSTGVVIPRSKAKELSDGHHVLVSALLVRNNDNKIMMQLTSKLKGMFEDEKRRKQMIKENFWSVLEWAKNDHPETFPAEAEERLKNRENEE